MRSSVTISLVPEARGGPFVFWDDLDTACAKAADLGFDAVEIFARSAQELAARNVGAVVAKRGLRVAALGSGAGWVVHKLRFTDPDREIRTKAIQFAREIVSAGADLNAPVILGSMQGRFDGAVSKDQALAWLAEAVLELAEHARASQQTILLEFLNRYETNLLNTVGDTLALIERLRAPNVKALADLFHMNIEETAIEQSLKSAGDRLGHVHFADSNRRAVGLGHTNVAEAIAALKEIGYTGYLSAEVLPLPDGDSAARQTIAAFRKLTA